MNAEQIRDHIADASLPGVKKASQNWKPCVSIQFIQYKFAYRISVVPVMNMDECERQNGKKLCIYMTLYDFN